MTDNLADDPPAGPTFAGFGEDLPMFYAGLEADNSKTYWTQHRSVYDAQVRGPMLALVADLAPEFGEGKVFRPNRDVRFSKDKSPYKTNVSAVVHGSHGDGVLYVQVDAEGILLAGGYYQTERDQIERYRAAVAGGGTGGALVRILRELREAGWEVGGEQLKRAPRGIDPGHPRIDLLRHKTLTAMRRWDVEEWLFEPELADRVARAWRELAPLNRWLGRHVGPHVPAADDRDAAPRR